MALIKAKVWGAGMDCLVQSGVDKWASVAGMWKKARQRRAQRPALCGAVQPVRGGEAKPARGGGIQPVRGGGREAASPLAPQPAPQQLGPPGGVPSIPTGHHFAQGEDVAVSLQCLACERLLGIPPAHEGRNPAYHRHDFFEINLVAQGVVENTVCGRLVRQGAGEIVLMNPGAAHSPHPQDGDAVLWNVLLRKEWVQGVFARLLSYNAPLQRFFLDSFYCQNHAAPYLVLENTERVAAAFQRLIRDYFAREPYYQQVLVADLILAFAEVSRAQDGAHAALAARAVAGAGGLHAGVLGLLDRCPEEASLAEIARGAGYSPNYMSRVIREQTGMTYTQIVNERRLRRAEELLRSSGCSIEMVGEAAGFSNASHLARAFRERYGVPPLQYRKRAASRLGGAAAAAAAP